MTRVLVTNDDGVHAPGLHALAAALVGAGWDVVVAAPQEDMSGSGAAIGRLHADQHIDVQSVEIPGLQGVPAFAVAGPPALAVMAARLGGFGEPPTLVASGINPGPNTGRSTLHSGTVGAALTAANFGISGLAVSIGVAKDDCWEWDTAAVMAVAALHWIEAQPPKTVVNLNVPCRPLVEVLGVRWASLAPFGTVRAAIVESPERAGRLQMELRDTGVELPADSDTALVTAGYAAVTTITGIRATAPTPVADAIEDAIAGVLPGHDTGPIEAAGA
jgi:5'-nucleotidase